MNREKMEYDLVIVGAGPSGLSAAIEFRKLCQKNNLNYSVCVVEKGSQVGSHILSGAVLETKALDELIPDWKEKNSPIKTKVNNEKFLFLTKNNSFRFPNFLLPKVMHNKENYIISLGNFCIWLAEQAENLGVEIYPGFSASEILFDENKNVCGIATGDHGILKNGEKGANYQQGIEIHSKYVFFAEGCRGHLGKQIIKNFGLDNNSEHQTYGIGLKELWEVREENSKPGQVIHSVGWPLESSTYGGSFLYHLDKNLVSVGFVIGLDYENPYLSPYDEFQRFKTHQKISSIFKGGRRISYGARALNEGGWQSLPDLVFPGGALIGCEAGTLNTPKIKGTHTAMKSGMIAASSAFEAIKNKRKHDLLNCYQKNFRNSWAGKELFNARNVRPSFRWGLSTGMLLTGFDQILLGGKAPWTLHHHKKDHLSLQEKSKVKRIDYPKPDGVLTFDKLTNVAFTSTYHEEDQPCHLKLSDANMPISYNNQYFDSPEQRYCPAGVYEVINKDNELKLQINAQNCIHCKTCDIKDPNQNITWVTPEGGGGPSYTNM
ncbi:electron transfer flavoprotein-ubiquinone oxidoreductase [Rickettsiales bacterium]|nr:electron transfer flavoprotein-ubiquinone oxidoreductase [Rickettsiales bacterium]